MGMGQSVVMPLHESGVAPRVLVTDFDRVDVLGDGLYTYVGTCPVIIDGHSERQVVIYITVTWRAVAKGILLSATHVVELPYISEMLATIKKACARLTMH